VFDRWTGSTCGTHQSVCNGMVSGDATAVARFVRRVELPVEVRGKGRVIQVGDFGVWDDQCRKRCTWSLPYGTRAVLLARPNRNMVFVRWEGHGCENKGPHCALKVSPRAHPVAVFESA
jgi:hypothetical protein